MNFEREEVEKIVRQILTEKLGTYNTSTADGLVMVDIPNLEVNEQDRMDTGNSNDHVYTKDFFDLKQSPRLGAGLMFMKSSTFDWQLNYDEFDYVIAGTLSIIGSKGKVTAEAGQSILIPKGSKIKFSAPTEARFIYITYPADWANQS